VLVVRWSQPLRTRLSGAGDEVLRLRQAGEYMATNSKSLTDVSTGPHQQGLYKPQRRPSERCRWQDVLPLRRGRAHLEGLRPSRGQWRGCSRSCGCRRTGCPYHRGSISDHKRIYHDAAISIGMRDTSIGTIYQYLYHTIVPSLSASFRQTTHSREKFSRFQRDTHTNIVPYLTFLPLLFRTDDGLVICNGGSDFGMHPYRTV
jgi:hypothetical protein